MKVGTSIRAIIFDFDGTLAKLNINFPQMRKSVISLIESYHIPLDGLSNLFVLEMINAGKTLISRKHPGKETFFFQQATDLIAHIEIEAANKGELIDGTRDMLLDLKKYNIKAGVVTRNCNSAVMRVFPDIFEYCDTVITRELIINVKPHPDHLMKALQSLDAAPEFTYMVGDHPMDIKMGKDSGTFTVGVLSGYSTTSDLLNAGADLIVDKAADLISVLL